MKQFNVFLFILFLSLSTTEAQIYVGNTQLDSTVLATNLDTPWDLIYTQDTSLWFTERIGRISRIDLTTNQVNLVLDYRDSVVQFGEGGLLGMAIIETTAIQKVFLAYNYRTPSRTYFERLVRFDYDPNLDTLINEIILIDSIPAGSNHNGSRIEIVNNQIFMSTGDAGNQQLPQDLNSLAGKILRVEFNGSIPNDNPIPNSPIYSWGHRNPQGLFFANGFLYSSEHGPNNDDEINIIEKGRNYGWPNVHGFCNSTNEIIFCNDSNVVEPLYAWTPTVATAGICYYNHPSIPDWNGKLLLATLKDQRIISLQLTSSKDSISGTSDYFVSRWGRLRDITSDSNGSVYIATNSNPQRIIKLENRTYTSLQENTNKSQRLKLYPNPVLSTLNIEIESSKRTNYDVTIYDLTGRKVKSKVLSQSKFQINLDDFTQGVYLIDIQDDNGFRRTQKLIVK